MSRPRTPRPEGSRPISAIRSGGRLLPIPASRLASAQRNGTRPCVSVSVSAASASGPRGAIENVPSLLTPGLDGAFEVAALQPGRYEVLAVKSLDALRESFPQRGRRGGGQGGGDAGGQGGGGQGGGRRGGGGGGNGGGGGGGGGN